MSPGRCSQATALPGCLVCMVSRILVFAGVKELISGSAPLISSCLLEKESDTEQFLIWNADDGEERLYPLSPEGANFCIAASRKFYCSEETLAGIPGPDSTSEPYHMSSLSIKYSPWCNWTMSSLHGSTTKNNQVYFVAETMHILFLQMNQAKWSC